VYNRIGLLAVKSSWRRQLLDKTRSASTCRC